MNIGNEVKFTYASKHKVEGWVYMMSEDYIWLVLNHNLKISPYFTCKEGESRRFSRDIITELKIYK